ncbi:MAG: multiprotein-bridging factor 1 family protein [Elainellaceae cyanobacterium]
MGRVTLQHQATAPAGNLNDRQSSSGTLIQLQLGDCGPDLISRYDTKPSVTLRTAPAEASGSAGSLPALPWEATIDQVITSTDLGQLIQRLQVNPSFTGPIVQRLFQHLLNAYHQQIAIAVAAKGLKAINLAQPHLRLQSPRKSQDGQAADPQLEIAVDPAVVQAYLGSALSNFCEHPRFRLAFKQFIGTHLVAWVIEDLGLSQPDVAASIAVIQRYLRHNTERLSNKIDLLGEIYSLDITQMIVDSLDLPNCSPERLETLMGLRSRPEATIDDVLSLPSAAPIPTSIPIASSIRAQLRPDLWQRDSELAVFQYLRRSNPANFIEHYITDPGDIALLPWEAAEQIINKLGFDTVKLQMIFAARAMDQDEPWNSTFRLRATDIVQLLGWDRNHNTSLPEKRNTIASAAHALSCLLVKSVWIEGRGRRKVDASTPVGRMWDVLVDPHGQIDWVTGKIERPDEVYITVTPGLWTKHFLNRAGQKAKAALHQFGYLARDILQIDPYHHEMALRLAIQLTLDARVRVHSQQPYRYQVMDLLKEVMPAAEIGRALDDKYKARDLKNRWNRALTLLVSLGWQIEYDPETYPSWLQPNSKTPRPSDWRRIKIIERLLQAHLVIRPPQPIPQLLAQVKSPRQRRRAKGRSRPTQPALPCREMTGDAVREGRQSRGWSRKELGGFLGVSADYVGKLERGDRIITPPLQKRLRKLLSLP